MQMTVTLASLVEMVMPVCADGVTDMFEESHFDLDSVRQHCLQTYGVQPDAGLAVREWGGRDLRAASNIIFSNGARDPWSAGGVHATDVSLLGPGISVIRIPHACHHEDLRSPGPGDPPALRAVREQEARILRSWLVPSLLPVNDISALPVQSWAGQPAP